MHYAKDLLKNGNNLETEQNKNTFVRNERIREKTDIRLCNIP